MLEVVVFDYKSVFDAVVNDPRYQQNLDWGQPRSGHPEGTVRAHIVELESNLELLRAKVTETEYWKLKLLIHVHDSFKAEAERTVPITHSRSHASLARAFLASFCDDPDLLAMVQYHDEPYALWRRAEHAGEFNSGRFTALLGNITDWNLFLAFNIVDACTDGKSRDPLRWLLQQVAGKVDSRFSEEDIL
jgi:hypothetical protein